MRLINAASLELELFDDDSKIPPYAILSHTWGTQEVSLQQFQESYMGDKLTRVRIKNMLGYAKILYTCKQALDDIYAYVWIDTCCIDKTSSAELSEAINSMFRWYREAQLCYAFLEDIRLSYRQIYKASPSDIERAIAGSRWFTRGWTLQELIAPQRIHFYVAPWVFTGTKETLLKPLTAITGIDERVLLSENAWRSCSVAKRMSWAAKRTTTRTEDIAYSLMGLFDINMPLLYGENEKAFIRLQEEIMMEHEDQSLLAWHPASDGTDDNNSFYQSVFAKHPRNFANAHNIIARRPRGEPPVMTNRGVRIELPVLSLESLPPGIIQCGQFCKLFIAVLYCSFAGDDHKLVGIVIQRHLREGRSHAYVRDARLAIFPVAQEEVYYSDARRIYLHRRSNTFAWRPLTQRNSVSLGMDEGENFEEARVYEPNDGYERVKMHYLPAHTSRDDEDHDTVGSHALMYLT